MDKKYYYIISKNLVEAFDIECESKVHGDICYLAKSCSTGEQVWIYKDCIEYIKGKRKRAHNTLPAYEVKNPIQSQGLAPYKYYWGGEIRDKRAHSMCARPYFPR
jgi:hypothetical protein